MKRSSKQRREQAVGKQWKDHMVYLPPRLWQAYACLKYTKNGNTVHQPKIPSSSVKSSLTLLIEHFNSKIREVYDVPGVLQYAHQFPSAVEEIIKRTTKCGFSYFTHRQSYYEVLESMISFEELPKLPRPPKHHGTAHEVALLRKWTKEYEKLSRQLSV